MGSASRLLASLSLLVACTATPAADDGPTTDATTDDTSTPDTPGCSLPVEIAQLGVDPPAPTGFVRCNDGEIHRAQAVECQVPVPTGIACDGQMGSCDADEDCNDGPYGACLYMEGFFAGCTCVYGCATDADCAEDQVCACGGSAPDYPASTQCISAGCTTTADCGDQPCALGRNVVSCGEDPVLGCRTEADACAPLGSECGDDNCLPGEGGAWSCMPPGIC
ncbi:MAG: hypothetical protein KDK70_09175 [Myxococcales bacterium]|nr:hypothetical protein [Myxococcales bacterium]